MGKNLEVKEIKLDRDKGWLAWIEVDDIKEWAPLPFTARATCSEVAAALKERGITIG